MRLHNLFITFLFGLVLTACTYTINMVHTEGSATDVVDDTTTATPTTNFPSSFLL